MHLILLVKCTAGLTFDLECCSFSLRTGNYTSVGSIYAGNPSERVEITERVQKGGMVTAIFR